MDRSPPQPRTHLHNKVVCPHCDGFFDAVPLQAGEQARCPDCRGILQRHHHLGSQSVLACALAGVIFLSIALAWPVLSTSFGGLRNDVSLLTAPTAFGGDWFAITACVMLGISVAVPLVQALVVSWLLAFVPAHRRAPGFAQLLPLLKVLKPWAMVEVFFMGTLIVIVKVGGWVSIHPGPGLWAVAAYSGLLAAVHRFESVSLWSQPEK